MPGYRFTFSIRIRREEHAISKLGRLLDLGQGLRLFLNSDVFRREVVVDVDAQLALGQVAEMPDGRLDGIAAPQILADRFRFCRGLHNDEYAALCRSGVGCFSIRRRESFVRDFFLSRRSLLFRFHFFFVIRHLSTSVQPVEGSHLYHPARVCASFTTSSATFSAGLASVNTVASAFAYNGSRVVKRSRIRANGSSLIRTGRVPDGSARPTATSARAFRYTRYPRGFASSSAPGCAAHPPPGAITAGSFASAASTSLRSISRNTGSPFSAKIMAIGLPSLRIKIVSMSTNPACSRSATMRPTVVLPAPGRPMSTTCLFTTRLLAACARAPAPDSRPRCASARSARRRRTSPPAPLSGRSPPSLRQ